MSKTVIFCEGYYDRAFWDGLLKYLGCTSLKSAAGQPVYDPFNIPERGRHVQNWLDARPNPPPNGVKEYAFSHMAGWYPEYGCDAFYGFLWNEAVVAAQLKARLQSSGAWQIILNIAA